MSSQSEPKFNPLANGWFNLPKTLFEQMQIGFAIFDRDLTLRESNSIWIDNISRHASSVDQVEPGMSLFDLTPEAKNTFLPLLKQAMAGVTIKEKGFAIKGQDSTFYYDLAFASASRQQTLNIVGLMIDVSKRRPPYQLLQDHAEIHSYDLDTLLEVSRTLVASDELYHQAHYTAVLEERSRLARELHDNIAQALGYMNLQTAVTSQLLSSGQIEEAQTKLQELKQTVGEIYTDVREEIFNLRATASLGLGFLGTLREYIDKYKKYYDLDVELLIEMDEAELQFPADVATQIVRVIQEALINVRKHSGVSKAVIRIWVANYA